MSIQLFGSADMTLEPTQSTVRGLSYISPGATPKMTNVIYHTLTVQCQGGGVNFLWTVCLTKKHDPSEGSRLALQLLLQKAVLLASKPKPIYLSRQALPWVKSTEQQLDQGE